MRMRAESRVALAVCLLVFGLGANGLAAQTPAPASSPLPVIHTDNGVNSAAARAAHYVVLVSLDGFRWDYARRDGAEHLLALGKHGVWAPDGMLPSFPSLTFPNHYTLVTGLYPEHHGIVANSFYDASRQGRYAMSDSAAVQDGSWYGGTPLWSLAESQGMRAACLFWVGSEAQIAGYRPTYTLKFDDKIDVHARIQQVADWLALPEDVRPHLIAIYFSEPDHEGHMFGPDAAETRDAVRRMDGLVGELKAVLDATKLPIDLVVVSDHGMVHEQGNWINLDQFADLSNFEAVGPLLYPKSEADAEHAYDALKKASSQFVVYRRKNVPANLHYNENPREGDPVVIPTGPYPIRAHGPAADKPDRAPTAGMHGFDPHTMPEMKASFFAAGPDIVAGKTVRTFENVNLYPWIAHLLGLKAPKTDGSLSVLAGTLRDGGGPELKGDKE